MFYSDYNADLIARSSTYEDGYEASGWLAVLLEDNQIALTVFSHCSCYGTATDFFDQSPNYKWVGSISELIPLVTDKLDPQYPTRPVNRKDYDAGAILGLYNELAAILNEVHSKLSLGLKYKNRFRALVDAYFRDDVMEEAKPYVEIAVHDGVVSLVGKSDDIDIIVRDYWEDYGYSCDDEDVNQDEDGYYRLINL